MATFYVHEDCEAEKPLPKRTLKPLKNCLQKNENRAVLKPLGNLQQNIRLPKINTGKENLKKVEEKIGNTPNLCTDIIALKPVFKRSTLNVSDHFADQEYEKEIWDYIKTLEKHSQKIRANYMTKQIHLTWNMRSILVDWLVTVADEYDMSNQTVHLSVNYLDRFLSNISVIREKFQLVGATAMLIASKMEEIYPLDTKEWAHLTNNTFTYRQFIKMEQLMLRILNFEMNTPTVLDFVKHLCSKHNLDNKTMCLAQYLSELMLLEGEDYLQLFPSKLAAASLLLARHTLCKSEPWTKKLEETAGYSVKQLSPVVQKQQKTFKSSPFKEQQSIQKKYASDKYHKVALLKPRVLVLDDEE